MRNVQQLVCNQATVSNSGHRDSIKLAQVELDKLLASRAFVHSERLKRFLRYTVAQLIHGQPQQVKEYSIGVEVFGRGPSYDPRTDSIVRVEAHRLRCKLKQYYRTEGRKDRLLIEIPKGAYVPVLRKRVPRNLGPIRVEACNNGGTTVAVLPFVNLDRARWAESFADGLTESVMDSLAHMQQIRVVSRTSVFQFKGKAYDIRKVGQRLGADRVIEGSVVRESSRLCIRVRLIETAGGCQLWSNTYYGSEKDLAIKNRISRAILSALRHLLSSRQTAL